ncbi:MAG TPA: hypothetical protein VJ835_08990 [Fimbriimonadaceae bacterium]|nr:hypothetical protein [Fimbriimonadaceae bacterium]
MLRDQIFNHPGSLVAGCAIWIPIGIWVLALVQWAIQGDVDVLSAFVGCLIGIGLGLLALTSREPYMAPFILTAVVLTMLVFPAVRSSLNRRALDSIDAEAIERAYEALEQRPTNAPAKFKLAKVIYNKGLAGHALALAESAITQMPEATFPEENRILKSWRHYGSGSGTTGPLSCLSCGVANGPGLTHCRSCGARFLLDHARGAWIGKGLAKKLIFAWGAIMVALVGIPWAVGSLPPVGSVPVIVGLMVMAVVMVVLTFRSGAVQRT